MTLDDFEKSLKEEKLIEERVRSHHRHKDGGVRPKRHGHHRDGEHAHHRHKRIRHSRHEDDLEEPSHKKKRSVLRENGIEVGKDKGDQGNQMDTKSANMIMHGSDCNGQLQRDSWMHEPSAFDINYIQKEKKPLEATQNGSSKTDFKLKIHENEMNKHHLADLAEGKDAVGAAHEDPPKLEVDYRFGDTGAQWRMTKLNGVYRRAKESGRSVDDVAIEQYGDLRTFDDSREEQIELDRRETYGEGYVGKERPSGELFEERMLSRGMKKDYAVDIKGEDDIQDQPRVIRTEAPAATTVPMNQSALNRLKAQMLKARVRGASNASNLEAEYNNAMARFANSKQPNVVVLGHMDNRMLAGSRTGEVIKVDNKRGRERGLVEENEDMSIEDMVKQERRTRHQVGGDSQRFAERIAKDAKFDNDLDYLDENANKLAKRIQKSEISLKNNAISDFQKMSRILDNCPLCHHENANIPTIAPIVSLATRVYLTLPTEPEISDGGACIIPIQHRGNLLECDDDEWEEIRNFMKSLKRMYYDQGRDVLFYENAAVPQRKKHAGMEVVPLPYSFGDTAPAFFREAILTSDEEWTQHKKIIDTLAKAKQGLGKVAFRRTLAKEMPYFHVWFDLDGGLGHIVEDANRWPRGDLFAREIIGGMLDKEPDIIRRQGKWSKGSDRRIEGFRQKWRKFDWTRVLTDL